MIRVFLSLPMNGRSEDEIQKQISQMILQIRDSELFDNEEIQYIDNRNYKPLELMSEAREPRLLYLGQAIKKIGCCDVLALGSGWTNARGCRIERAVADEYDIPVIQTEFIGTYLQIEGYKDKLRSRINPPT